MDHPSKQRLFFPSKKPTAKAQENHHLHTFFSITLELKNARKASNICTPIIAAAANGSIKYSIRTNAFCSIERGKGGAAGCISRRSRRLMEENTLRLLQQQWRWVFASCGLVGDGNDEDAALGWGTGSKGEAKKDP
ncbi:hypothetical protein HO133_001879 [Letharia lupina]|uniref:Uncharacterized protein n=1 Tax=Letharia lupina TaxID=560253 RepID=A0A8H6CER9_9LECA|nr:uncharacterized protein HO133_001879 [Letharia lupina]KAF6221911.1 hypothetical protein HO133_001879 [Letharia lupina]